MNEKQLDLGRLPARLAAHIESTEALLSVCRSMLRGRSASLVAAYAERAVELSESLDAYKSQARQLLNTDSQEAATAAGAVQ